MLFSSVFFIYVFLPVTLLLYYIVPFKLKNAVLLLVSLVFYAWGEPVYVFLMIFSILFNYLTGIELGYFRRNNMQAARHTSLVICVAVNIGLLGFFKYFGFIVDNINALFHANIAYHALALPIGISFYTFQTMSYVIDVYRGKTEVQYNLITFGAYVTMFPQLIAGPIVRYADVEKQLKSRKLSLPMFGDGVLWFLRGLGKKVLLANNAGMVFDALHALNASEMTVASVWLAMLWYAMQIYFDFSGYSDMAIGLGKMLGFEFMKNFDYPFISRSVAEIWRRWHISLGSWFREYVYIPLGGSRGTVVQTVRNLAIVWLLTGLWHGAAWNYIFWGLIHGTAILVERYMLRNILKKWPDWLQWLYANFIMFLTWPFFSSSSLRESITMFGYMFGVHTSGLINGTTLYYLRGSWLLLIICLLCSTPIVYRVFLRFSVRRGTWRIGVTCAVYAGILFLSTAYLVNATYNPFLYFRF